MRRARAARGLLWAAAVLLVAGCGAATTSGRAIAREQVRTIVPGKTTKTEALARFGAPLAIAAPSEVIPVAADPAVKTSMVRPGTTTWSLAADNFFELFPDARKAEDCRRIYYFRRFEQRTSEYFLLLGVYGTGTTTIDRLWLLVDERTRIVEDYAYKESGQAVVFGVPRAGAAPRPSRAPDRR